MKNELIKQNMIQLSQIPTILKRIENTEYSLIGYKNTMLRFYKEKRIILLYEIRILKSFKVRQANSTVRLAGVW